MVRPQPRRSGDPRPASEAHRAARPPAATALMAGSIATFVMTPLAYLWPAMDGDGTDFAALLGSVVLGGEAPRFGVPWLIGMLLHMVNGVVIFPLVYAFALYPRLPGPPLLRGTLWGVALWLVSILATTVILGSGAFSMAFAARSLVLHLVYGALLGWISSSRGARQVAG